MKYVSEYIKTNAIYWLCALMVVITMGLAQQADARPVLNQMVGSMSFYKDDQSNDWTIRYLGITTATDETFETLTVAWNQTYRGEPLVLMVGKLPGCPYAYRLYWGQPNGDIRQAKGFGNCNSKEVGVTIKDGVLHLFFEGYLTNQDARKRVPLI